MTWNDPIHPIPAIPSHLALIIGGGMAHHDATWGINWPSKASSLKSTQLCSCSKAILTSRNLNQELHLHTFKSEMQKVFNKNQNTLCLKKHQNQPNWPSPNMFGSTLQLKPRENIKKKKKKKPSVQQNQTQLGPRTSAQEPTRSMGVRPLLPSKT